MPVLVAHVDFHFEAESVGAGGRRLRELAAAARTVGFELRQGKVEFALPSEPDGQDWTRYALDER